MTSAVTSLGLVVSLLDTDPLTSPQRLPCPPTPAGFQAQLWPFQKGQLPPPLLTMAEGTLTWSPNIAVHLHSLLAGDRLAAQS